MSPATTTRRLPEVAELRAVLRAVRTTPTGARIPIRRLVTAGFLAILLGFLHTAPSTAWNPSPLRPRPSHEESQMSFPKIPSRGTAAIVAAAVAASSIPFTSTEAAQDAVQWRVEDGGNGHWYRVVLESHDWYQARDIALALGGHLVTITSSEEQSFLTPIGSAELWMGGFAPPGQGCGTASWQWVTSEEMNYLNWSPGEPGTCGDTCMAFAVWGGYTGRWNNQRCDFAEGPGFIIEWSADCNADGIVDYGQIVAGELADADGNNIPDCCEAAVPCVPRKSPRQWARVDGGNGHWYACVRVSTGIDWESARTECEKSGGHLATLHSLEENDFAFAQIGAPETWPMRFGPWLGGYETKGGWAWVTGEEWSWTNWYPGEPNNVCPFGEDRLHFIDFGSRWNDLYHDGYCGSEGPVWSYLIEWSADCNNDGVVDYGQILAGELADTNANNVPDCCEGDVPCGCGADFNGDGSVTSADFANLLTAWGATDLPPEDLDRNGIVDANDMAILLDSWGPCR